MLKLNDVYLIEAKDGNLTKVKIGDETYLVFLEGTIVLLPETEIKKQEDTQEETSSKYELGPTIGIVGNTRINKNLYENFLRAVDEGKPNSEIKKIFKQAKPNVKIGTIGTYLSDYKRYNKNPKLYPPVPPNKRKTKYYNERNKKVPITTDASLGQVIGKVGTIYIHKNLFENISKAIDDGLPIKNIEKIIGKAKPSLSESSLNPYFYSYRRFKENPDEYKIKRKYKKRESTKHWTKRPADAILYSKTYGTYVNQTEFDAVRNAIVHVETNYVPTFKTIKNVTQFKEGKLYAIIDAMKEDKKIVKKTVNDEGVYQWIGGETTTDV